MGAANLIPGVSGGTIALVIGIYERLVASIREGSSALGNLLKGDLKAVRTHLAAVEWVFLLSILAGVLGAVLLLASFLERLLEERPTVTAALFFGLVFGSVVIAWRLLKDPRMIHVLIAVAVGVTLFLLLGLGDAGEATDPSLLAFFVAGALAICSMILPGISGALILLLVGMYAAVLSAWNERDFASLGVFALGAIIGLALFSQFLHWALNHYHDLVLAGLVGLMAGSLRRLWPWPDGVDTAVLAAPGEDWLKALAAMLLGVLVVLAISRLAANQEEPA